MLSALRFSIVHPMPDCLLSRRLTIVFTFMMVVALLAMATARYL